MTVSTFTASPNSKARLSLCAGTTILARRSPSMSTICARCGHDQHRPLRRDGCARVGNYDRRVHADRTCRGRRCAHANALVLSTLQLAVILLLDMWASAAIAFVGLGLMFAARENGEP